MLSPGITGLKLRIHRAKLLPVLSINHWTILKRACTPIRASPCYFYGRGDWIRTSDPLLPRQVRCQTALLPDER